MRGLVSNRILIDISHMGPARDRRGGRAARRRARPRRAVPIVSTHAGYRFGRQQYMHDDETLRQISAATASSG